MDQLPPNTRITPARKAIIEVFTSTDHPLSAAQIHKLLKRLNIYVNITTIYRELDFLLAHKLIQKIDISGVTTYYESTQHDHHHHVVCTSCGTIQDVHIEKEDRLLQNIHKPADFMIQRHSLEFYGLCGNCN